MQGFARAGYVRRMADDAKPSDERGVPPSARASRLRSLAYKLYGEPPPKGAPRYEMLRWIRGFYFRQLPPTLAAFAVLAVWASATLIFLVLAVSTLIWLQGVISLSLRIRREEQRDP